MKIAIIPARGGSRRIPGKNGKNFHGRPLLDYPIRACLESGLFDHILVSTDSPKLAELAQACGAEAPFLRPAALADDYVATAPVVEHALGWCREKWGEPKFYCQLYANPFIRAKNLLEGYNLLLVSGANEVLAVTEFPYPILRAFRLDKTGAVTYAFPEYRSARSQDLPVFYHDAAQFYWHAPIAETSEYRALPFIVPRHMAVDIDTQEDWLVAERLYTAMEAN